MKLNLIKYELSELINEIVIRKHEPRKSHLKNVKEIICQAESEYKYLIENDKIEEIKSVSYHISDDEEDTLAHCYINKPKALENILNNFKSQQTDFFQEFCPYCGIRSLSVHDHYLPQSKFPEFSISPMNLVPCCSKCNLKKTDKWSKNNRRLFLNKYFDNDEDIEFLIGFPEIIDGILTFKFDLDYYILKNTSKGDIIRTHYENLELLSLYNDKIDTYISTLVDDLKGINDLKSTKIDSIDNFVRERIEQEYDKFKRIEGKNSYKSVTLKTILQSKDCVNWIIKEIKS